MEVVVAPKLHPLSCIDFQTKDELMQYNSITLTFNSFQFLKKTLEQVLKDKHTKKQEFA
jgi:hypothetical protein